MAKEKAVKVKETKSTVIWNVPAYSDGKLVGHAQCVTFKETDAGLAAAKVALTQGDLADLNRQRLTDSKNNLRRGTSILAALRQLTKTNPAVEKIVTLLVKQAQSGKFDAKALEAIEAGLNLK